MIEYLLFFVCILIFAIVIYTRRRDKHLKLYLTEVILSFLFALIVIFLYYSKIHGTFILLGISILAPTLFYQYTKNNLIFGAIIAIIYVSSGYWIIDYHYIIIPIVQIFAIGLLISSIPIITKEELKARANASIERKRDVIQIIMGIIVISTVYLLGYRIGTYFVLGYMLFGYMLNSYMGASSNNISKKLKRFEREGILFGRGALYLGIGTIAVLGFIDYLPLALSMLIALFISDAVATIVGIGRKTKLPYNKNKSILGFIGYFGSFAIAAYLFIGIYSIPLGAALALIESISIIFDDNITIAIAGIILYKIISFI